MTPNIRCILTIKSAVVVFIFQTSCAEINNSSRIIRSQNEDNYFYIIENKIHFVGTEVSKTEGPLELYRVTGTNRNYRGHTVHETRTGFGGGKLTFNLDRYPISQTQSDPKSRKTTFILPDTTQNPNNCYLVMSNNKPVGHFNSNNNLFIFKLTHEDFLINLDKYFERRQFLQDTKDFENRIISMRSSLNRIVPEVEAARHRVKHSHRFVDNVCEKRTAIYPPEPEINLTEEEADRISVGIYAQFLIRKYQCNFALAIFGVLGSEFRIFRSISKIGNAVCTVDSFRSIFGFGLFDNNYAKYIRRETYSSIIDLAEIILSICATFRDRRCQIAQPFFVVGRALININEIKEQLLEPRRNWIKMANYLKQRSDREYQLCLSDVKLLKDDELELEKIRRKIEMYENFLSVKKQKVVEYNSIIIPSTDLMCKKY